MACLDEALVLDLIEGRLAADDEVAAKAHLDRCDDCRRLVAEAARAVASERSGNTWGQREAVGRYVLLDVIGAGSMGVVYSAYDPQLARKVALKLINPAASVPASALAQRLLAEAQAMARLAHPAVVAVYDAGVTQEGQVYAVIEHVEGVTLRRWLAASQRGWRAVVDRYQEAGMGLAAAHRAGIVHGDFKPANVMLGDDGRVRVTDFGLAHPILPGDLERPVASYLPPLSAAQATPPRVGGTPAYMAPELFSDRAPSAQTDQFSFCVALYEGLYGERPFTGDNMLEIAQQARAGRVRPAPRRSEVPGRVRAVLLRGLAADPGCRFPSMEQLLRALSAARHRARRRAAQIGGALGVALVAVLGARELVWRQQVCAGAEALLGDVWDGERQRAVREAFERSGASFSADAWGGVARAIDGYTADWVRVRTDACRATRIRGEQSEGKLDRRMECLDSHLRQLDALVDVFAEADRDVVARSVEAALALPASVECQGALDERELERAPQDPALQAQVAQVRDALTRAKALEKAGRYAAAKELVAGVRAQALDVGWLRLESELLTLAGRISGRLGDIDAASADLKAASEAALVGGYDSLAARSFLDLVFFVGHGQARFADAHRWDRFAQLAIERAGGQPAQQAERDEVLSIILWDEGELDQAEAALERARELYVREYGPEHIRVAHTLDGIATILFERGELERAQALNLKAVEIAEHTFGLNHPSLLAFLNNLGNTLALLGRYAEAHDALARSLAIAEELLGPDHTDLVPPLDSMGSLLGLMGQHEQAAAQLERAAALLVAAGRERSPEHAVVLTDLATVEIARGDPAQALTRLEVARALLSAVLGPDHPQLAATLCQRGQARLALGDPAAALEEFGQALAIVEAQLGEEATAAAPALLGRGEALLRSGQPAAAVEPLERALRIRSARRGDPRDLAEARLALARALRDSGGDQARARELAEQASAGFAAQGWSPDRLRAAQAWLAQSPEPRAP